MNKQFESFYNGVLEALYFAETVYNGEGNDLEHFEEYELSEESKEALRLECSTFLDKAGDLINEACNSKEDYDYGSAGNDFWFTRQGHGVGYWDRGLKDLGDSLTKICRTFPEKHLFLNDKNQLEID